MRPQTVRERATELGLVNYDGALPQEWVDEVYARTGVYLPGQCVWSYDGAATFGRPIALTDEVRPILEAMGYPQ